jgi:hypothetical protein
VPGSYRVTFNTDGGLSGQAGVTIDGLGESEPQTIALRHAPAKE